jgi:hypothetical protein
MPSPDSASPRIAREKRTIRAMIAIYCKAHHAAGPELCDECRELCDYALSRLDCCRYGAEKPVCNRCPIHCYRPALRARVREVMRYAGPRMLLRHPILALGHQWDSLRRRAACKRPPRRIS